MLALLLIPVIICANYARADDMTPYAINTYCPEEYLALFCCSPQYPIEFNFTFGCNTYESFSVGVTPSITFNSSQSQACYQTMYPSITPYLDLDIVLNNGTVYGHNLTYEGEHVRVIEWSGLYDIFPSFVHPGTVQLWLFPNGTYGIIYHLTGQLFVATSYYCSIDDNNQYGCFNISFAADTTLLRTAEAYLFTPSTYSCLAPYTQKEWKHPPDMCLNPTNVSLQNGNDDDLFIPDVDCTLENTPNYTYCASRGFYPNEAYNASGITYKPLKVCPADLNPAAVFNNTVHPHHAPMHKRGDPLATPGAIAGMVMAGGFLIAGIVGLIMVYYR